MIRRVTSPPPLLRTPRPLLLYSTTCLPPVAPASRRAPSRTRTAFLAHRPRVAAVACAPEMPQHEVVRALAAEAEARLGSRLLPSAVPADVAEFRNGAGNAVGSLDVRRGAPGSSGQFLTLVAGIR
jgi:red chlorophyll catabolite reductase